MNKIYFFCFVVFCTSCNFNEQEKVNTKTYFDIEGFFKKEAQRLTKNLPIIRKKVIVNGKAEQKDIVIKNWDKEFEVFISADINKASWKEAFSVENKNGNTIYTSNSEKIPVKKLEVSEIGKKITSVKIYISNKNYLYKATDTLIYYPDSIYQIKNTQKVNLLKQKNYQIIGSFK